MAASTGYATVKEHAFFGKPIVAEAVGRPEDGAEKQTGEKPQERPEESQRSSTRKARGGPYEKPLVKPEEGPSKTLGRPHGGHRQALGLDS